MPRWPKEPLGDKPLASASRNLRQREREQKAAAKRAAEATADVPVAPSPPLSGVEYVAALRQSLDARAKLLEHIRQQVERIAGRSSMADLKRLSDALSLHERRIARRDDPAPK